MQCKKIITKMNHDKIPSYPILIQAGLLKSISTLIPAATKQTVIVTDKIVNKIQTKNLISALSNHTCAVLVIAVPSGEKSKSLSVYQHVIQTLLQNAIRRDALILAVGGGVIGDLAGFVAATYLRGISYIQIPTSLLAMIDSSIGGKTAINLPAGKNLIGAFYTPKKVLTDIACLQSLPKKHYMNGLYEIIKIFLLHDKKSFYYFVNHFDKIIQRHPATLRHIIYQSIQLKSKIVKSDFRENNQRATLNFGHTIGHALEAMSQYKMLHGIAVGYGMLLEAKISEIQSILPTADFKIIQEILSKVGIHIRKLKHFNIDKIITQTYCDKKNSKSQVKYVLLKELGNVHVKKQQYSHPVSDSMVKKAYIALTGG